MTLSSVLSGLPWNLTALSWQGENPSPFLENGFKRLKNSLLEIPLGTERKLKVPLRFHIHQLKSVLGLLTYSLPTTPFLPLSLFVSSVPLFFSYLLFLYYVPLPLLPSPAALSVTFSSSTPLFPSRCPFSSSSSQQLPLPSFLEVSCLHCQQKNGGVEMWYDISRLYYLVTLKHRQTQTYLYFFPLSVLEFWGIPCLVM